MGLRTAAPAGSSPATTPRRPVALTRQPVGSRRVAVTLAVAGGVAAVSLAVVAAAPSYDPWAWLLWGREISGLELSTVDGPAFKPLPVAICALLAPLGDAIAPVAWVWLARTAAVLALIAAFRLASELAGGSRAVGLLAALGVTLTGSFLGHAASGLSEPALIALALTGVASARRGHVHAALACAAACGLIRVETWPFLVLAGAVTWRRHARLRPVVALLAVLVPLAWFGPELVGSGDLLRSGERAQTPNPGQPALAPVPALASLQAAMPLVPWPLWLGVGALLVALARPTSGRQGPALALAPALAGCAWLALVAAMAQAGFSGEPRYALPGAALVSISGAIGGVGLLRRAAPRTPAFPAALVVAAVVSTDPGDAVDRIPAAQAHHWRLSAGMREAIEAAGGRRAVLACGTPYVGPYRGTLAAYQLDVAKHLIEPDAPPRTPGVVFQSRLKPDSPAAPMPPAAAVPLGRHGAWRVFIACRHRGIRVP